MKPPVRTLAWNGDSLEIINQRLLPGVERYEELKTIEDVYDAIRSLKIRGAPAIGLAASFGLLLAAKKKATKDRRVFLEFLSEKRDLIGGCRPTAYNLFYGINRLNDLASSCSRLSVAGIKLRMEKECLRMFDRDIRDSLAIGRHGIGLIKRGMGILTHCNAGGLATAGYGTALAPIFLAHEKGMKIEVFIDETRPVLQGARLTAWELKKAGVAHTLICDDMAAFLMKQGRVDIVITGADRICANGDTANKIGTYGLAVLARHHGIPMYIAAPLSTFDFSMKSGSDISIEERDPEEVSCLAGIRTAPRGTRIYNPSFDVTPADLITRFITGKGVLKPSQIKQLR